MLTDNTSMATRANSKRPCKLGAFHINKEEFCPSLIVNRVDTLGPFTRGVHLLKSM